MPSERAPQSDIIRDYLDGSLASDKMSEAEGLIERDPKVCTVVEHDKLETFIGRLQEALAMPPFPAEQDDQNSGALRRAVAEQIQQQPKRDDTAAFNVNDPSVATDSQAPAVAQEPGFAFLSPPQAADEIGRLNGYRVLRLLGQGGMGVVFEAEDARLKRRVALKVMKPEIAAKEEHRVRFLREAQTAAAVEHDHICPIYQVGEENGVPFIAMPFLKGEPLDARLKQQKLLPVAEAIRIGREVAQGLAQAHKAGLVHRDIKPANIWLETLPDGRSRCRILDFGLARSTSDDVHLTRSGAIMGTPAYMAPEQARGRPVDHRADLFSLGVILYEMTTGRRPFSGGDTMSILTSLALDEPAAPNLINPAVPAELADLIMQLLSKPAEKRPANGQAVAEALLAALMKTSRPIVEVMPGSAAPPQALPMDQTAVDPWQGIDDSVPSEAAPPKKPTENQVAPPPPKREVAPKRGMTINPQSRPAPSSHRSRTGWGILSASLFLLIGGGFAAFKLYFETKDGTLVVQVDGDADVRFKNGQLQIFDADNKLKYTLTPSEKNKTLPPGKYLVKIVGADGIKIESPEFVMEKNGKASVRVVAERIAVAKNEPKLVLPTQAIAYGLGFDGNAEVAVPSLALPETGSLTLEAYVTQIEPMMAGKQALIVGAHGQISLIARKSASSSQEWWQMHAWPGKKAVNVPAATELNRRVHLAGVKSGKTLRIYVDGKKVDEKEMGPEEFIQQDRKVTIGDKGFIGVIQEVRISKAARYDKDFKPQARFEPDAETLALYHMDEGAGDVLKDSSGNAHHGKIVGAKWVKADQPPITPPTKSEVRYALAFDGTSVRSAVAVPSLKMDPDSPQTFEFYGIPAVIPEEAMWVNVLGFGNQVAHIQRRSKDGQWNWQWAAPGYIVKTPVVAGRRVHLAGVFTRDSLQLFVDGKKVDEKKFPKITVPKSNATLDIGQRYFGTLEQIRISKGARYDKDFTPARLFEKDADTLALYYFDEGTGDVLTDSSGNGHHGKIVVAKWVKVEGEAIASGTPDEIVAKKLQAEWVAKLNLSVEATNKIGMKLRLIPPGVGVPKAFYLGKYEVTQGEWEQVLG